MVLTLEENLRRILHGELPDRIPVLRADEPAYCYVTYRGALPPSGGGIDLWGVTWSGTAEALPYPTLHPASSLAEALRLPAPDPHDPALWVDAQAQAARSEGGRREGPLLIGRQVCALFERLWSLVGMEEALVGMAQAMDQVEALLDRILAWQLAIADHLILLGLDAARISDDYGAQNGLMMRPAHWRRAIRPRLASLSARYQAAGLPVILHSCGNLTGIMDDLVELGFAAFNIQASANDLPALRARYGRRFRVWGGISTQTTLSTGSPEEIRDWVLHIGETLGAGGGLVLEPDQTIAIPAANLAAYHAAVSELSSRSSGGFAHWVSDAH